jgi:hypothetical protein
MWLMTYPTDAVESDTNNSRLVHPPVPRQRNVVDVYKRSTLTSQKGPNSKTCGLNLRDVANGLLYRCYGGRHQYLSTGTPHRAAPAQRRRRG